MLPRVNRTDRHHHLLAWPLRLGAVVVLALMACARVKPWQRGRLAGPAMAVPRALSPLAIGYEAKLLESKTAGGVAGVAAGGGCGCTQ